MRALILIVTTILTGAIILIAPQFTAAATLTMMVVGPLSTLEL
jgi:hypothetical protein